MDEELKYDWRIVADEWYQAHAGEVIAAVLRQKSYGSQDQLYDAFVEALLDLAQKPEKIDLNKGVVGLLIHATKKNLIDIIRSASSEKNREFLVAKQETVTKTIVDDLGDIELACQFRDQVCKTDQERKVLDLWAAGHEDQEIAQILNLDLEEARKIRDRVTQRLRRLKEQYREPGEDL